MKNLLRCISKANNYLLRETNINDALNYCISSIGVEQGLDRCYIFVNKIVNNDLKLYYEYEWCNTNIEPFLGNPALSGLSYDEFPGLHDSLSLDKPICGLVKDSDNALFKATMEMQSIQSYLFTPIFSNNAFWGWIGYDDCTKEKQWIEEEVYALHTIAKNIGLRLHQEETINKLKINIEKFDFYMSNSNQAMWELELDSNMGSISNNWTKMLGYENDMILNAYELFFNNSHPDDSSKISTEINNFIIGKSKDYSGVARVLHKKGHYVTIKYFGVIKKDEDGKPSKMIGSYIDISELKEKERQLKVSEEKFRFIANNTTDIICQHNIDGGYTYISNSIKEILGYEPDEMLNKIAFDFIHPDDLKLMFDAKEQFIKDSKHIILTYRFRKKDNTYVWLETTLRNILNEENIVVGIQSSSRDVSERIKAEEEIKTTLKKEKQLNEMKSRFVTMASHQFRTPLTVIYSNAELIDLKTNHFDKKTVASVEYITSRIKKEVDRMTELMNNILIFGKYESKKIKKEIKILNLNKYIKTVIDTYFDKAVERGKIQIKIKGRKQVFQTDETLLTHILTNLISNAFKYSAGKPNPLISISYLKNEIEIEVTDFGIGIPEDEIQYLFTSFFRASNTSTIIGSGLGLTIVKQFTVFLNGKVELRSKENFGTTIKLNFPYEQN